MTSPGKRVHERFDVRLPCALLLPGPQPREVAATTRNASLGGVFVETTENVAFGSSLKLRIRLPAMHEDSTIDCTVRWKTPEGVGLQFGSLRAIEVWALNQIFKT